MGGVLTSIIFSLFLVGFMGGSVSRTCRREEDRGGMDPGDPGNGGGNRTLVSTISYTLCPVIHSPLTSSHQFLVYR